MRTREWLECLIAMAGLAAVSHAEIPTVESNSGDYAMESTTTLLCAAKTTQSSGQYTLAPGMDGDTAGNAVQACDWAMYE